MDGGWGKRVRQWVEGENTGKMKIRRETREEVVGQRGGDKVHGEFKKFLCEAYVRYDWRGHNSLDVVIEILENIQMTLLGSIVARRLP